MSHGYLVASLSQGDIRSSCGHLGDDHLGWLKSRYLKHWGLWFKIKVAMEVSRGRLTWTCSVRR